MAYLFSPYEIAVFAIKIEESGLVFYTKIANLTKDESVKHIFQLLSDQEAKHKKIFEDLAKDTEGKYPQIEYQNDINLEVESILNLITRKSFDYDKITSDAFNLSQAIEVGIQTEIQSISIYQLAKNTFNKTFAPVFDQIIAEEQKHLDLLEKLRQT
jgi:rubrerythrin